MRTPRILYLVPDLIGPPSGIARYCRMVCLALSAADAETQVVSLLDQPSAQAEAAQAFASLTYFPCRGSRPLFVVRALLQALRRRPDLILIGHANFSGMGWMLARLCRAKFVVWMYGTDVWQPLAPPRRRGLRKADLCLSISRFTAERAARGNGVARSRTRILFNCLDPAFEPKYSHEPALDRGQGQAPSILTVSRISLFEPFKGHEYVIQAMPALLERFPELMYHIVGDGDRRPLLEDLAREIGVAGSVRFHGVVSDEELARLYTDARLFIMPSQVEGFGFVFLEAMAQGTPAIGGDRDATPEVIVDGETGFVVDPTNVGAIVEAASRLLGDEALRQRMRVSAASRAAREFGFAQFQETLLSHLAELCPGLREPESAFRAPQVLAGEEATV